MKKVQNASPETTPHPTAPPSPLAGSTIADLLAAREDLSAELQRRAGAARAQAEALRTEAHAACEAAVHAAEEAYTAAVQAADDARTGACKLADAEYDAAMRKADALEAEADAIDGVPVPSAAAPAPPKSRRQRNARTSSERGLPVRAGKRKAAKQSRTLTPVQNRVLEAIRAGAATRAEVLDACDVTASAATRALAVLVACRMIRRTGTRRAARYEVA